MRRFCFLSTERDDPCADRQAWTVKKGTWLRIWQRFGLDEAAYTDFVEAWKLAVHEATNRDDDHHGDLTGIHGGRDSPVPARIDEAAVWLDLDTAYVKRDCRGGSLTRTVAEYGPDVAAMLFAAEEFASPDLTDAGTLAALRYDGTVAYADAQRWRRIEVGAGPPVGDVEPFVRRTEGLLTVVRTARAEARRADSPEALDARMRERREGRRWEWKMARREMRRLARSQAAVEVTDGTDLGDEDNSSATETPYEDMTAEQRRVEDARQAADQEAAEAASEAYYVALAAARAAGDSARVRQLQIAGRYVLPDVTGPAASA